MAQRTPIKIPMEAEPEAGSVSVPSKPPMPLVRRPAPVTNALLLGQHLADALGAARALINRIPSESAVMVDQLRRWYYGHDPAHRDRLLGRHFEEARETHVRLEQAIQRAREALDLERPLLVQAQAEREALATRRLPATVEEEATNARPEAVLHYQSLSTECQQRASAIAELERVLLARDDTIDRSRDTTTRVLEATITVEREAFVRRVRESSELEHLRTRFERLQAAAQEHDAEVAEWSQRAGRPLRVPSIELPWPAPTIWKSLLDTPVESPRLVWSDDPNSPGA